MTRQNAPALPDGLVVFVKRECATCQLVAPLLPAIDATVYTQDDPTFPDGVDAVHDDDLRFSWHHDIETVPTLIRVVDGVEAERTVGWLATTGSASPATQRWAPTFHRCDPAVAR